jgi:hypothetical protein
MMDRFRSHIFKRQIIDEPSNLYALKSTMTTPISICHYEMAMNLLIFVQCVGFHLYKLTLRNLDCFKTAISQYVRFVFYIG